MSDIKNFVWTDDLVKEFACKLGSIKMEDFKYFKTKKEKVKPKVRLFTSEDGVEIYPKDVFWYKGDDWKARETCLLEGEKWNLKLPAFSNKDRCNEYILQNKPIQVSYKELKNYLRINGGYNLSEDGKIIEFFKSKINL